jgi:VanZ family protein
VIQPPWLRGIVAWTPSLFWAALLFRLSSIPGADLPRLPGWWSADKFVHGGLYAVFGALCWFGLRVTWTRPRKPVIDVLAGGLFAAIYGITDELHQAFTPGRSPDVFDVMADFVGGLLGALACVAIVARRRAPRALGHGESSR